MKNKTCGRLIREYNGKRLYCGKGKWFGNKKVTEICEVCKAYNTGYKEGLAKKIKQSTLCQFLTCARAASHVISVDNFMINVCKNHARGKESRLIKRNDI